ncbi:MAG: gamma-glutamyltransferase [Acidobacteria bacterium]|nr:gamma-glutamyltransferase [Acidobacteriota bacterium]
MSKRPEQIPLGTKATTTKITVTDLDVRIRCSCPAQVRVSGATTVSSVFRLSLRVKTPLLYWLILVPFFFAFVPGLDASDSTVQARRGMVVSSHPDASRVGIEILQKGGNAVDAAVAVGFALAVVHPIAGNIGGGGFMLIHVADRKAEFTLDYRETAPRKAHRRLFEEAPQDASTVGHLASAVPGSVAGLYRAWKRFGSLPWQELVQPAVKLAAEGFQVNEPFSRALQRSQDKLSRFAESRRIFLRDGLPYQAGEVLVQSELARTLERIMRQGANGFYKGATARLIEEEMKRRGGLITASDLKSYRAKFRDPVRGTYRGLEVISMGLPSSGGMVLLQQLNMAELFPISEYTLNSTREAHLKAEIMRRAFADRAHFLGDGDFVAVPVKELLSKKYAQARTATIAEFEASKSVDASHGTPDELKNETTHYSIVDTDGNAVAATTTLNGNFGSGLTIPGGGFLMNNEMDDFTSRPGVPNMFGLIQAEANAISPRKRPLSAMTPTLVKKNGSVILVSGSPGGPTIISTVFQIILNLFDHHMSIREAVEARRIHHQWMPDEIVAETGALLPPFEAELKNMGHKITYRETIGEAHTIAIDENTSIRYGVADPRGSGKAMGY